MSDTKEMARFEALAEEAWTQIYDSRHRNARECFEDARYNLERALAIAEMRGLKGDALRLGARLEHMTKTYATKLKAAR